MSRWPIVQLRTVIEPIERPESPVPGRIYRQVGVKLWGEGAYEREPLDGGATRYAKLFRAEVGDVIVNKIWARNGSVAVVPGALAGCFASGEFPMFVPQLDRLEPRWIHWLTKTSGFWAQCDEKSRGTSGKNRIRPERFSEIEIPLPPLAEQRRVVARVEELARQIDEARSVRRQAVEEVNMFIAAMENAVWADLSTVQHRRLDEVTCLLARGRQSEQGESNHYLIKTQHVQLGRYVSTRLTLAAQAVARVNDEALVRSGDILIACSAAGCLGRVARYTEVGKTASTDTHVAIARPDPAEIHPDYLYSYLKSAPGQLQLRSRERGDWQREKVGFRLTELNLRDLQAVPVPLPRRHQQQRIVDYLRTFEEEVGVLRRLQGHTSAELDAVLPATLDRAFKGTLV
jgi:type I restriction enzyme, S subunit